MATSNPSELIAMLRGSESPRAPSLLVTVFGDLVQGEGARIGAPVLGQILELIGVRPDSMRVALHRLRKDGWIASERAGRSSEYYLTEFGRAESMDATPRIYASSPPAESAWLVVFDPAQSNAQTEDGVSLSGSVKITGSPPDGDIAFATCLEPDIALPDWMRRKVCEPEVAEMSKDLAGRLIGLQRNLRPGLNRLEAAALRVLIVHSWRRIVLKTPLLPDHVFPVSWQGPACRAAIADLLSRLPKPELRDLAKIAAT